MMQRIKMELLCTTGIIVLLGFSPLHADSIGGEISLGFYNHSPSGYASYTDPFLKHIGTTADLEETLHWTHETDLMLKAYIEHPMPMLPNIKLALTNLSHEGEGSVNSFTWGSIDIPFGGSIENSFDMTKYDLTLYYELLDNWAEIDIGATLGYLDGNIAVTALAGFSTLPKLSQTESIDFSIFLPTLYGKARFTIPTTDLSFQFEGDIFSYDKTSYYTYEASIRYTFSMGLGIEGGWKSLHFDSTDLTDGLILDMDFNGPYATIVWDF